MTRDQILALAKTVGMVQTGKCWAVITDDLERFANVIAAIEREECALLCEQLRPSKQKHDQRFHDACTVSAAVIRSRNGSTH